MNHDGMQTDAGILELIRDRLNVDVVDVDADMIETGVVDSLALVTLITAIEEMFACELPLDDFDIDRFRSVDAMAAFLAEAGVTG